MGQPSEEAAPYLTLKTVFSYSISEQNNGKVNMVYRSVVIAFIDMFFLFTLDETSNFSDCVEIDFKIIVITMTFWEKLVTSRSINCQNFILICRILSLI